MYQVTFKDVQKLNNAAFFLTELCSDEYLFTFIHFNFKKVFPIFNLYHTTENEHNSTLHRFSNVTV